MMEFLDRFFKTLDFGLPLAAILLLTSVSYANNRVGNGGYAVVCQSGKDLQVRLLDFVELDPGSTYTDSDWQRITESVVQSLAAADEKTADMYSRRLKTIGKDIAWKTQLPLAEIGDAKSFIGNKGSSCAIKPLAIRKNEVMPGEQRFLIQKELFDQMSVRDQAGLILHEILYEHLFQLGEKDSLKVRKLLFLLFSERFEQKTGTKYWATIRSLKIPIYP